ncbi:GerMN domain-containing protein [Brevibacillus migulae]|uniref:GerMN domain-containing protein n=1 Tax=Brevibacillus migulae TaxID=1644114 RepID=UPI00106E21AB|nr:GerMN domain-containing protein [Brevibacillus migulae]
MKRMIIVLSLFLIALLSACGTKPVEQTKPAETHTSAVAPQPQPAENSANSGAQTVPKQNVTKEKIAVYFTDADLTQLIKEEQEIRYSDQVDKYKQAIASLEKPANAGHVKLWENFGYHSVTFSEGTVTIDTKGSNIYNVGASGEALALDALKQTLYQFPEVKKIVVLQDGQAIESLMGHMSLEEALAK